MSRSGDYKDEMSNATVSEQDIERLLTGSPPEYGELSDLVVFVEMLRAYDDHVPSDIAVDRIAGQTAGLVRTARSSARSVPVSPRRRSPRWRALRPQMAAAAIAILMIGGATGVAAAADAAAPGHALYLLDRALERIGFGDGKAEERLEEATRLLAEGKTRIALVHAGEALEEVGDQSAKDALDIAIEGLETIADQDAAVAQEKVGALLGYMSQNIGERTGTEGREFGRGLAEIARGFAPADATDDGPPVEIPASGNPNKPDNDQAERGNDNEGTGNQGTGGGKPDSTGNGEGNGPDQGSGDNQDAGNGNLPGNGNPPGNGNLPGNGNGNGPGQESPSVTAPGRGNRP